MVWKPKRRWCKVKREVRSPAKVAEVWRSEQLDQKNEIVKVVRQKLGWSRVWERPKHKVMNDEHLGVPKVWLVTCPSVWSVWHSALSLMHSALPSHHCRTCIFTTSTPSHTVQIPSEGFSCRLRFSSG
jgi:hypothetical protein